LTVGQLDRLRIPILLEGRVPFEHASLLRDPVLRGEDVPHGDGGPVLLIPGFLAGDPSLRIMAAWLKRLGHRPCRARMRVNADCATRAVDRLEEDLERLYAEHGRRVAIVGQSRGGTMARLLAVRRPDLVASVTTLGSPLTDFLAVHPLIRVHVTAVGALGTLGVPGLFRRSCTHGECCAETRELLQAPFPEGIPFVSLYSRTDGIVDWRTCLDPDAQHVEVGGSHIGMAVSPAVFRAVAAALAPPARARPARRAAA
jgi:pimeloyl-ACP methyl ester carboxylesterase